MPCPRAPREEQQYPEETSAYAEEGTAAHELAAFVQRGGGLQAIDLIGTIFNGYTVDEEMAGHVQRYIDEVREPLVDLALVEQAVPIGPWTGEVGATGTADWIGVSESACTLYVSDLKYGRGVRVEAEGNEQLMLYGLGAWDLLDPLFDIETVVLKIIQPRLGHVSSWALPLDELLRWGETQVVPAAVATRQPDPPYNPGAKQCRWCRARGRCPAQRAAVEAAVLRQAYDTDHLPEDLTLVQLVRDWATAVEDRATATLLAGQPVAGWKLVESRTQRQWRDESAARRALRKLGLQEKDFIEKKLRSVAQIERLLGKDDSGQLVPLVDKPRGRPTLAPAADKRPEINLAEVAGFPITTD